jgi:hypothetical protein
VIEFKDYSKEIEEIKLRNESEIKFNKLKNKLLFLEIYNYINYKIKIIIGLFMFYFLYKFFDYVVVESNIYLRVIIILVMSIFAISVYIIFIVAIYYIEEYNNNLPKDIIKKLRLEIQTFDHHYTKDEIKDMERSEKFTLSLIPIKRQHEEYVIDKNKSLQQKIKDEKND